MGKLARIAIGVFEARHNHVCRYPTDWVPPCIRLKSSPTTADSTPSRKGLQYHRMSPWLQTRSWCQRSLTPPRAPWHQARRQVGKGSSVTTCRMALDPPPGAGGLWCHHVRSGLPPGREGLRCCHVSHGFRPTSRCGRSLASPRAPWLSAFEVCPCIPKAHDIWQIMTTPGTRSRQCIKCV
jgi:hypothetical protein